MKWKPGGLRWQARQFRRSRIAGRVPVHRFGDDEASPSVPSTGQGLAAPGDEMATPYAEILIALHSLRVEFTAA